MLGGFIGGFFLHTKETVSAQANTTVVADLPTFESVRSTIYREERKQQHLLPTHVTGINLGGVQRETLDGRDFLLFDKTAHVGGISCFCMQEALQTFCEAEEAFADGTFLARPALVYPLLTISIRREGASCNVAYVLSPGKS